MSPSPLMTVQPADVLDFWREAGPTRWFRKDTAFDTLFRTRFLAGHEAAARGELDSWHADAAGVLALLLLLDQFPRNAFRDTPRMFQTDPKARDIALRAFHAGFDRATDSELRNFFYLPFVHSEALPDQDRAVELARGLGGEALRYAIIHRDIIEKFGRFPHRNEVLGRTTTPEERKFLEDGGFPG